MDYFRIDSPESSLNDYLGQPEDRKSIVDRIRRLREKRLKMLDEYNNENEESLLPYLNKILSKERNKSAAKKAAKKSVKGKMESTRRSEKIKSQASVHESNISQADPNPMTMTPLPTTWTNPPRKSKTKTSRTALPQTRTDKPARKPETVTSLDDLFQTWTQNPARKPETVTSQDALSRTWTQNPARKPETITSQTASLQTWTRNPARKPETITSEAALNQTETLNLAPELVAFTSEPIMTATDNLNPPELVAFTSEPIMTATDNLNPPELVAFTSEPIITATDTLNPPELVAITSEPIMHATEILNPAPDIVTATDSLNLAPDIVTAADILDPDPDLETATETNPTPQSETFTLPVTVTTNQTSDLIATPEVLLFPSAVTLRESLNPPQLVIIQPQTHAAAGFPGSMQATAFPGQNPTISPIPQLVILTSPVYEPDIGGGPPPQPVRITSQAIVTSEGLLVPAPPLAIISAPVPATASGAANPTPNLVIRPEIKSKAPVTQKPSRRGYNGYGHVPGIEIGHQWSTRLECSHDGVHRPTIAGIHPGPLGAYSIALSGGYVDDVDGGDIVIFTGAGGRDSRGSDGGYRGASNLPHVKDQILNKANKSLLRSVETGFPVRVIRGHKLMGFYAPDLGYRYDGLYQVLRYTYSYGNSGYLVFRFMMVRLERKKVAPWLITPRLKPIVPRHNERGRSRRHRPYRPRTQVKDIQKMKAELESQIMAFFRTLAEHERLAASDIGQLPYALLPGFNARDNVE